MRWFSLFFCLFIVHFFCAQDIKVSFKKNNFPPKLIFPDSITLKKNKLKNKLANLSQKMVADGYLLFSYDSIIKKDSIVNCYVSCGDRFNNVHLQIDKAQKKRLLNETSIRNKELEKLLFRPADINRLLIQIRDSYLNSGYPFVDVKLEKITLDRKNNLKANLFVEKGNSYMWSTLHIKGDSSISIKFLTELLGLKKGQLYNESRLKKISKELDQLLFIKEIKPHDLLFTPEGVEVFLFLKSKKASSANGMVGLQPNTASNTYRLAGELKLKLSNVLKRGEKMELHWKGLRPQTQSLFVSASVPFLFNTSFGVGGETILYKQDSSFLELKSSANVQYFIGRGFYIKGLYKFYNNRSFLSKPSDSKEYLNIRSNSYGMSLFKQKLDYLPNPSKGFLFSTELSFGNRKTLFYEDSLLKEKKSLTTRSKFCFEFYYPIFNRHIFHGLFSGEQLYANDLFNNELVRFGGLNSLRGFNEEELFASANVSVLFEYRFLVDKNSNAFVFYNQAWYENSTTSSYYNDYPFGFGLGYSFGSKLGVFSVIYALGSQLNNPIELRNGKLHVGYVSYF